MNSRPGGRSGPESPLKSLAVGAIAFGLILGLIALASGHLGGGGQQPDSVYIGGPPVTINLESLPAKVPADVASKEHAVVTVNVQLRTHDPTLTSPQDPASLGVGGSGVVLSSDTVLSAGHIFAPPALSQDGGAAVCHWTSVDAPTTTPAGYFPSGEPRLGTFHHVSHIQFVRAGIDSVSVADASLVHIAGKGLSRIGSIQLAPHPPAAGSRVYFVNYEDSREGRLRDPFTGAISVTDYRAGMSHPVAFGGFVLGRDGDTLNVIDGIRSYGVMRETKLRPGGSGGAVLNGRGQLVGISDQSANGSGPSWQDDFSAHFSHVPRGYVPALSVVQLLSSKTLSDLRSNRTSSGHC